MDSNFPQYDWKNNKGYPTVKHREAIRQIGMQAPQKVTNYYLLNQKLNFDTTYNYLNLNYQFQQKMKLNKNIAY